MSFNVLLLIMRWIKFVFRKEIWLLDVIFDFFFLNYVFYRRDRTYIFGGSVVVYVNCKIGSCRFDVFDFDGILELLWV